MGPIPKSWKRICQTGVAFSSSHCNRMLISARYYLKGYKKFYGPLNRSEDYRRVPNILAIGGFAHGTASDGAPLVRLAIYKECWPKPGEKSTCSDSDKLAAIDDANARADDVDVLSISIGTKYPLPYIEDSIAFGALHATKKNILVSCFVGNSGPEPSTLSHPAPLLSRMVLVVLTGQTVTPYVLEKKLHPLVYAGDIVNPNVIKDDLGQCLPGSLAPEKAKGNIVLCMKGSGTRIGEGIEVKRAGGACFILGNSPIIGAELVCDAHALPATAVTYDQAMKIYQYTNSTKNPMAIIIPGKTLIHTKPAPVIASLTSRVRNVIKPNILKDRILWQHGARPFLLQCCHIKITELLSTIYSLALHLLALMCLLQLHFSKQFTLLGVLQ